MSLDQFAESRFGGRQGVGHLAAIDRSTEAGGALVVSASPDSVFAALGGGVPGADGHRASEAGRPARQRARAAAHLLVRWCAARVTGRPLAVFQVEHRCGDCGSGDHGKPSLAGFPDLHVSLAHRPDAVVAAAGWSPVAVDVEAPAAVGGVPSALLPDVLTSAEVAEVRSATDPSTAFLRLWVRKECLVKLNVTSLDAMRDVDLAGAVSRPLPGSVTWTRYGRLHLIDWCDGDTGALVAAAGSELPVRGSLPSAR
jgi:4'-phosphopantetheinyl transferase